MSLHLPTFAIRPAIPADLPALLEARMGMIADVFAAKPDAPAWNRPQLVEANRRWLESHLGRDFAAWIAEASGEVAGSVAILWFDHPPTPANPDGREAYVLNVYTHPAWRRKGVARALMERVLGEADAAGAKRVWLRSSAAGRHLYESLGFAEGMGYLQLRQSSSVR